MKHMPSGSAVLSALLVVSITAVLASTALLAVNSSILRIQAQKDISQAQWIVLAVTDYARWVLTADLRGSNKSSNQFDHLSEPWAQIIPFSRLDELFIEKLDIEKERMALAGFEGFIRDEQSKLNIAGISDGFKDAELIEKSLKNLFLLLKIEEKKFRKFITLIRFSSKNDFLKKNRNFRISELPDLLSKLDLSKKDNQLLSERLIWLPEHSPVNINTASVEVISAIFDETDTSKLSFLLETRKKYPFRSISEIESAYVTSNRQSYNLLDTKSSYFSLHGTVIFNKAENSFRTLLRRFDDKVVAIFEDKA